MYLLIGVLGHHNFHWGQVVYRKTENFDPVIRNVLQTGRQCLEAVAPLQNHISYLLRMEILQAEHPTSTRTVLEYMKSSNLSTHTSCTVSLWRQKLLKSTKLTRIMTSCFTGLIHLTGMVMLVSLWSSEGMDSGQDTISLRGTAAVHTINSIWV